MTDAATFEELGLSPELVESLAAEGFERPTPFQVAAIPVLRRGNAIVGAAGPGAGLLLSYACPLLDRLIDGTSKGALVLGPSGADAIGHARALATLASGVGVSVAALRSIWAAPGEAQIVFGTPADVLGAVQGGELKLDGFDSVVVLGATAIDAEGQGDALRTLLEQMGTEGLRAALELPVGPATESIAERFFERPVHVPPRSVSGKSMPSGSPTGTTVLYQIVGPNRPTALLQRLADLAQYGRKVAILFRTDDQLADIGDLVSMYGYDVGEVGDPEASVWIAHDFAESVAALQTEAEPLSVVCYEAPAGREAMERAADDSHEWLILARAAEMPHLNRLALSAGVRLRAAAPLPSLAVETERAALATRLAARLEKGGLAPYARMASDLLDGRDAIEVAAAALALVAETPRSAALEEPETVIPRPSDKASIQAWSKLFVSVGERDGVRIGDLLGAVTNEAQVKGQQVGRIDVQDAHSLIEVDGKVADRVIKALNGTSIRGRSLRVDYDRSHRPEVRSDKR